MDRMSHEELQSSLQGIAIVLLSIQVALVDIALFPDGGSLIVVGAVIVGVLGVIHAFWPLL